MALVRRGDEDVHGQLHGRAGASRAEVELGLGQRGQHRPGPLDGVRRAADHGGQRALHGQGGWGGTVASIVADEGFEFLDAPVRRVPAACVPLPFADALEEQIISTVAGVLSAVRSVTGY